MCLSLLPGERCPNACACPDGMKWDSTARPPRCLHSCAIRTCGDNEEFKTCGTACEPTCQNPFPGFCTSQSVEGCQCLEGFVRNDEGNCVRERECVPKCGENEEFKTCGTHCEKTCWSQKPKCIKSCNENVCQCKEGFLREKGGACVEAGSCKPQARYNCKFGDLEFLDRYSTKVNTLFLNHQPFFFLEMTWATCSGKKPGLYLQ